MIGTWTATHSISIFQNFLLVRLFCCRDIFREPFSPLLLTGSRGQVIMNTTLEMLSTHCELLFTVTHQSPVRWLMCDSGLFFDSLVSLTPGGRWHPLVTFGGWGTNSIILTLFLENVCDQHINNILILSVDSLSPVFLLERGWFYLSTSLAPFVICGLWRCHGNTDVPHNTNEAHVPGHRN